MGRGTPAVVKQQVEKKHVDLRQRRVSCGEMVEKSGKSSCAWYPWASRRAKKRCHYWDSISGGHHLCKGDGHGCSYQQESYHILLSFLILECAECSGRYRYGLIGFLLIVNHCVDFRILEQNGNIKKRIADCNWWTPISHLSLPIEAKWDQRRKKIPPFGVCVKVWSNHPQEKCIVNTIPAIKGDFQKKFKEHLLFVNCECKV